MYRQSNNYFPVTRSFVKKTMDSLKNKNESKYIYQIFEEIEMELHQKKDRPHLPVYRYNNKTEYIKFAVNQNRITEKKEFNRVDTVNIPEMWYELVSDNSHYQMNK